jgi:hypothetical protein
VIASQFLQVNFSRTCSTTFHRRGTHSSVSVTSSPSFLTTPPHLGQAQGAGWTMRSRGRCSGNGRRAGLRADLGRGALTGAAISAAVSSWATVSSSSASWSSSWAMIFAPRSEDWPYCSRRALASSSFRRSISRLAGDLGFSVLGPRFGFAPRRPLGEDHRMRGDEIGGQRIGAGHAAD